MFLGWGELLDQLLSTKNVEHALKVVGHGGADFDLRTVPEQAWVAEDTVFECREGMFDSGSRQLHGYECGPLVHTVRACAALCL